MIHVCKVGFTGLSLGLCPIQAPLLDCRLPATLSHMARMLEHRKLTAEDRITVAEVNNPVKKKRLSLYYKNSV